MINSWEVISKQLSLYYPNPSVFVISQWQKTALPNIYYFVYRWLIALYFSICLIFALVDLKHPNATPDFRLKWLIYLTNWGFLTCFLQAFVGALMLTGCYLEYKKINVMNLERLSLKLYPIYWIINVIATDIAFGVTSLYWSLIYNEKTMDLDAMNLIVHASNSIIMFIDLFMVSHPIRPLHFIYPVLFGLSYAAFSAIYYFAGGLSRDGKDYIYNILKWEKPQKTILVCAGVIGFVIILHLISWFLSKVRIRIHSKLTSYRKQSSITKQDRTNDNERSISTV